MPSDYTPEDWTTGDQFTAASASRMSQEIDEEEGINTTQAGQIAALQADQAAEDARPRWVEYAGPQSLLAQAVPAGAIGVRLTIIPGGFGGGSGRRGAAGTVRCGGGGGATPGPIRDLFIPVRTSTQWELLLGAAGVGGAAVTVNDTNGNDGGAPGTCSFRFRTPDQNYEIAVGATVLCTGKGGGVGAGGTGGTIGQPVTIAIGGSASLTGGVGGAGSEGFWSDRPGGAGAGGGITAANVASAGGNGGANRRVNLGVGGVGGVVGGAAPTAGQAAPVAGDVGVGPGGGAASITAAAQDGANGVGYGSPGGGGGASLNGFNSGKGGNGGPAYACLEWVYV